VKVSTAGGHVVTPRPFMGDCLRLRSRLSLRLGASERRFRLGTPAASVAETN